MAHVHQCLGPLSAGVKIHQQYIHRCAEIAEPEDIPPDEYLSRLKELGVIKRDGDVRLTHVSRPEREEKSKREKMGCASMEVRSVIQVYSPCQNKI